MSHPFAFRPGTNDEAMFRHLTTNNEYRLPDQFRPEDIVVDVGVHIGGFSYSALSRGARQVFGFEVDPSNCECARQNLSQFGDRARIQNRAVWRSDQPAGTLRFSSSPDRANTGGGSVFWDRDGLDVAATPFDDVIREISEGGRRRIHLLKIDCEGSEFPILLTARQIGSIDRIVGEFHEMGCARNPEMIPEHARVSGVPEFTVEVLVARLRQFGFHVTVERTADSSLGLFFASREPMRDSLGGRLKTFWRHFKTNAKPLTVQTAESVGTASGKHDE
jgi:FkbM family methyltransferase